MGPLLAVEEFGSGEPLVLIHGLATTQGIWHSVTPALARERRVVTLDVPGFGDSPPVGEGFDLEAVAKRILRGLAAQGVRGPFDLVGHSLGAGIAVTIAAIRPRAVRRLVLVAPAGFARLAPSTVRMVSSGVDGVLALRRALVPLTDLAWGRRLLLAFAAADGAALSPTQARLLVGASASAQRTAEAFATIAAADLRPVLRRVRAPLGVIWGAEDRTVPPRTARSVLEARPDAEIVLIEDAGHVAMVERPEAFVTALEGLLANLPRHATSVEVAPSNVS
jgi:pimeloyl-ACP methyl ester carboxylesterase